MHEAALCAKQYLEDLLSFFGLKVDVAFSLEEDCIQLDIPSTYLNGFLIGKSSATLRAIHNLTVASVQHQTQSNYRLNIDIAGYKKQQARRLTRKAEEWIKETKEKGIPKKLAPMSPPERRLIHQLANAQGVQTESQGQGLERYVVLKPADSSN